MAVMEFETFCFIGREHCHLFYIELSGVIY